jgi:hypothetical protein
MAPPKASADRTAYYGVDLGTSGVSLGHVEPSSGSVEILLDDLAFRRTPPTLAFSGRERLAGHQATTAGNAARAPDILTVLLGHSEAQAGRKTERAGEDGSAEGTSNHAGVAEGTSKHVGVAEKGVTFGKGPLLTVPYVLDGEEGESHTLSATQLLAMLFAPLKAQLIANEKKHEKTHEKTQTAEAATEAEAGVQPPVLAFALPDNVLNDAALNVAQIVADAAALVSLPVGAVHVSPASQCVAASYAHRHRLALKRTPRQTGEAQSQALAEAAPDAAPVSDEASPVADLAATGEDSAAAGVVLVLDVGHSQSQVTLLRLANGEVSVIDTQSEAVGGQDMDLVLFEVLAQQLAEKGEEGVTLDTKSGVRLLREVAKPRRVLSANSSCSVVLECFGAEGRDYKFDVTREQFNIAAAPIAERLVTMVRRALQATQLQASDVTAVELIGGCTCVPMIQAAVQDVVGEGKLRTTLDRSLAMAVGAAKSAEAMARDGDTPAAVR